MSYERYKKTIRSLIQLVFANDISWYIASPIFSRIAYLNFLRRKTVKIKNQNKINHYFNDLTVKNGIFQGIVYPKLASFGSALYPKLLGSYEAELHEIFSGLISNANYDLIIDIGCAEGYYLTGLGMKFPTIPLYGIDISETALAQCREMLSTNHIATERYKLLKSFDLDLITRNKNKKALIISDCEGYEEKFFTQESIPYLSNHDILIECHDFIAPGVTGKLVSIFQATHQIKIIESVADEQKLSFIPPELEGLTFIERLELVKEGRPCKMNWIIAISLQSI